MPADLPRRRDRPVPEKPDPRADDTIDLIAMEEAIFQAEKEQLEKAERRASELCRAVERGEAYEDFLDANEIAPGHTIGRHVGKEDAYLRERGRCPVSTFTDFDVAEKAIAQVLRESASDIERWLGKRPDEPGRFVHDVGWSAGRVLERGGTIRLSARINLVLLPTDWGYRIKTAYLL